MRADSRSDEVVRGRQIRDPVTHRFVCARGCCQVSRDLEGLARDKVLTNGIFERLATTRDSDDLGAQHLHPEDVKRLSPNVLGAHVHHALQPELGAHRRGRDTVLPGSSLGDDAFLAKPASEKDLPHGIVDLVGSSVVQVFALEPDSRASDVLGQSFSEVQPRRPVHVDVVAAVLGFEGGVGPRMPMSCLELCKAVDQCFRDILPAEFAESRRQSRAILQLNGVETGHWGRIRDHGVDLGDRNLFSCLCRLGRFKGCRRAIGVPINGRLGRPCPSGSATAYFLAELLDRMTPCRTPSYFFQFANNLGSDHHTIGHVADFVKVCGSGDAEANGERNVAMCGCGGERADARDEARKASRDCA